MKALLKDFSLSALVAGLLATTISYAGPLVLIFHAAESAGLSQALLSSWVWAISIGSGALGLLLSLRYRTPVVIAWSIPGSALLVGALPELGLNQAIGAYLVANLILLLIALSGSFDRLIAKLPGSIAAGLQAGILFAFGIEVFKALPEQPVLIASMFVTYLLLRRLAPRYAVAGVLLVGAALTLFGGQLRSEALARSLNEPAERDAGLFTFLVTASGVNFLGLSAAFWGLLFGLAAHLLLLRARRQPLGATNNPRAAPLRE